MPVIFSQIFSDGTRLAAELFRKVVGLNDFPFDQSDRPFQHVFQFPDISRERNISGEAFSPLRTGRNLLSHFFGEFMDEMIGQEKDILASFS